MKASLLFILLSCVSLIQGWVAPPPSRPAPFRYYAIGDSFAAGLGAGQRLDTSADDKRCLRSNSSYPELFKEEKNVRGSYENLACPDVDMIDVLLQAREIPSKADLISLSWGLDKIVMKNVVYHCVERFLPVTCNDEIERATGLLESYFPGGFFGDMVNIIKRVRRHAPNALIVVLGYPRFFNPQAINCDPTRQGNTGEEFNLIRKNMQKLILLMNDRIQTALENVDRPFRIKNKHLIVAKFPDEAFSDHRYCDENPWFNPHVGKGRHRIDSEYGDGFFHPNVDGQKEYMNLLLDAWEEAGRQKPSDELKL